MQHLTKAEICREQGDITQFQVDAIVNAANEILAGGSGVDGAIHRAAGPKLLEACLQIGGCPTGNAVITPGFNLPARYVIHTVGPIWRNGENHEATLLAKCYRNVIKLAESHRLSSIAFPAISCGAYGYPASAACEIAISTVLGHLKSWPESAIQHVYFVAYDQTIFDAYEVAMTQARDELLRLPPPIRTIEWQI